MDSHMRKISCVLDFRKRNGLRILFSSSRWANFMCQTIPKSQWRNIVEVHFFACLQVQHTFERVCYVLSHGTRFHPSWGAIFGQGPSVLYMGWWKRSWGSHRRLCAQAWRHSTPFCWPKPVMWPHLTSRLAGKYSVALCPEDTEMDLLST